MSDRRFGKNAVTEIEDERAFRERFQYAIDGAIERVASRKQNHRVEITLHRDAALDRLTREHPVDAPIEPHRVYIDPLNVTPKRRPRAPREADDSRVPDD